MVAKRKTKNKFSWLKSPKNRPQIFLAILILSGGGFFVYQSYAKWQDKHKFEQAQASIDELYADIVSKVGQPGVSQTKDNCRYASLKYSRGPLSCGFEIEFAYKVNELGDEASTLVTRANKVVNEHPGFANYKVGAISDLPFKSFLEQPAAQSTRATFTEKKTNLDCSLRFVYFPYSNDGTSQFISSASGKENLSAQIGCGGYSKEKHYPLEG